MSSTALQKQVGRDHQCARGKRACASPTVCRSKGACSEAWRDLAPTVTRCAQCAWEHRGSALEGPVGVQVAPCAETPAGRMKIRCLLRRHRWATLTSTRWIDQPTPSQNRYGVAMEYRTCRDCPEIKDVTGFFATADSDLGVPNTLGPIASARFRAITHRTKP